jgi:hypothetical protein
MQQRSRSFLLVLLTLGVGLSSCKKDPAVEPDPVTPPAPTGVVKLTVVPEWEGAPMQRFTEYRNFMDYRVNVELLKLYLGEVRLANGGVEKALSDVLYFDLGDGPVSQTWRLDTGTWTGMKAGLGVPSLLNYADPAGYGPGHPLNVSNGTYWTWATGYRFVMFEGRYDPDPLSTDPLINSYSLHPGMDTCYAAVELWPSGGIQVRQGDTAFVTVRLAVDEFFHSANGTIDLVTENTAHGGNLPLALKFTDNVVRSISVD